MHQHVEPAVVTLDGALFLPDTIRPARKLRDRIRREHRDACQGRRGGPSRRRTGTRRREHRATRRVSRSSARSGDSGSDGPPGQPDDPALPRREALA